MVVVSLGPVVHHGHDVGVVVFVVVVERVEENAQAIPHVGAAKHGALVTFIDGVPVKTS